LPYHGFGIHTVKARRQYSGYAEDVLMRRLGTAAGAEFRAFQIPA
jgi:hypothetical protein